MNFHEAEQRYASLKEQRSRGSLTSHEFTEKVNELRFKDEKGDCWQIREADGGWLRWTGMYWVEATPPASVPGTTSLLQYPSSPAMTDHLHPASPGATKAHPYSPQSVSNFLNFLRFRMLGHPGEVEQHLEQVINTARLNGDRGNVRDALRILALLRKHQGKMEEALKFFDESWQTDREMVEELHYLKIPSRDLDTLKQASTFSFQENFPDAMKLYFEVEHACYSHQDMRLLQQVRSCQMDVLSRQTDRLSVLGLVAPWDYYDARVKRG